MTSDNQSTAKTPDSAVSPTISAGEAPLSFDKWSKNNNPPYWTRGDAQSAWQARDAEVTALKQELAQAKEEITRLEEVEHYHELFVADHKRLLNELTSERSARAALEVELAKLCPIGDLEAVTSAKVKLEHMRDELLDSTEKLAQMTTAFLTTEDALNNSKKALAALEGKLGEMRKVLETIANSDYRGNRSSESTIAYEALKSLAALEPIKKEEGDNEKAI